jgi:hypothetical protein
MPHHWEGRTVSLASLLPVRCSGEYRLPDEAMTHRCDHAPGHQGDCGPWDEYEALRVCEAMVRQFTDGNGSQEDDDAIRLIAELALARLDEIRLAKDGAGQSP